MKLFNEDSTTFLFLYFENTNFISEEWVPYKIFWKLQKIDFCCFFCFKIEFIKIPDAFSRKIIYDESVCSTPNFILPRKYQCIIKMSTNFGINTNVHYINCECLNTVNLFICIYIAREK